MGRTKTRGWSARLAHPMAIQGGVTLWTLMDAGNIILATPERHQMRREWQSAAGKLMRAAETGALADIEAATKQMELALLLDGRLRPE